MVLELLDGRQPARHARRRRAAESVAGRARRAAGHQRRSSTRTRAGSCTATSSPRTCCSTSTASCGSPTSVSPARSPRRAGPSPPAPSSAPRATRRPSRPPARRSTAAPTSTRSRSCSSSRSRAPCRRRRHRASARSPARTHTPLVAPLAARAPRSGRRARRAVPSPSERYPDAATMRAALADAARALPPPQPLPLAGLGGEIDGGPPTQIGRSLQPVRPGRARRAAGRRRRAGPSRSRPRRRRPRRARCRWVSYAVIVAILLAILGGGIAIAAVSTKRRHGRGAVARRAHAGQATDAISRPPGSTLTIVDRNADDPPDTVIAQDPAPGVVRRRRQIESRSSSPAGHRPVADHACQGASPDRRAGGARGAGLRWSNVKQQYDETVPSTSSSTPTPRAARSCRRDSTIVARERRPAPVPVPDVTGKTFDEASQLLTAAGFTVARADDFSDTVPQGQGDRHRSRRQPGREPRRAGHRAREQGPRDGRGARTSSATRSKPRSSSCRRRASRSTPRATCPAASCGRSRPAANTSVNKGTKVTLFF